MRNKLITLTGEPGYYEIKGSGATYNKDLTIIFDTNTI